MEIKQPMMSLAIQMPLTVLAVDQAISAEQTYTVSLKMALKSSAPVQIQPGDQSIALSH